MFASPNNVHVDIFNTRFWAPGSEAVDAFTCDWGTDINWLFPPVYPRVIRQAQQTGVKCGFLPHSGYCSFQMKLNQQNSS